MSIQSNINAALSDARRVQTEITAKTAERTAKTAEREAKSAAEQVADEIMSRGTEGVPEEDKKAVDQEIKASRIRIRGSDWDSGIKTTYSEQVSREARDYVDRLRARMLRKKYNFEILRERGVELPPKELEDERANKGALEVVQKWMSDPEKYADRIEQFRKISEYIDKGNVRITGGND